MSGPVPKSGATRQRRNKTSTASRFETHEQPRAEAPELGDHPLGEKWHPRTLALWDQIWESPMADEYLRADTDGLHVLAVLSDQFWKDPNPKLSGEIRLLRQCFGLTPIDRRRLQWEIVRVEQAERRRPASPPKPKEGGDPRSVLRAI